MGFNVQFVDVELLILAYTISTLDKLCKHILECCGGGVGQGGEWGIRFMQEIFL
jgi:hypothetical protein